MANPKQLTFGPPMIRKKVVLSKGPSGWLETFERKTIDVELTKFVEPATVDEAVELFVLQRQTAEDKTINWETVVGFLGRLMNTTPLMVPHTVGVAFWARVILSQSAAGTN